MGRIIEIIKNSLFSVSEKVRDLYSENKKMFLTVTVLFSLIIICLILLLIVGNKQNTKEKLLPLNKLELTEKPVIPDGPELPRDYNVSRKTKDKWTDEEAKIWFTVPDEKEINTLSVSNDNMIDEIIKAAP